MLYTLSMENTITGVTVSPAARLLGIPQQTVLVWEEKDILPLNTHYSRLAMLR